MMISNAIAALLILSGGFATFLFTLFGVGSKWRATRGVRRAWRKVTLATLREAVVASAATGMLAQREGFELNLAETKVSLDEKKGFVFSIPRVQIVPEDQETFAHKLMHALVGAGYGENLNGSEFGDDVQALVRSSVLPIAAERARRVLTSPDARYVRVRQLCPPDVMHRLIQSIEPKPIGEAPPINIPSVFGPFDGPALENPNSGFTYETKPSVLPRDLFDEAVQLTGKNGTEKVRNLLLDGEWWTLHALAAATSMREQTVSARVRTLRAAGAVIEKRRVPGKVIEYRMVGVADVE